MRFADAGGDPPGELVEHGAGTGVAGACRRDHVLAPDVLGVAARQRDGGVELTGEGGVARPCARAPSRRRSAPSTRACRTGSGGPAGSTSM